MKIEQILGITVISSEENYTLYNGEIYCKEAYLGINDSPSNWQEIPDEEVPQDE